MPVDEIASSQIRESINNKIKGKMGKIKDMDETKKKDGNRKS